MGTGPGAGGGNGAAPSNPASRYLSVTGFAPTWLWLGVKEPAAGVEILVQQGAAQEGIVPTKVLPSPLATAHFRFTGGSSDAWRAPLSSIGDLTAATLITCTWRSRTAIPPIAVQSLINKRANAAPNVGHEHTIDTNGMYLGALDDDPTAAFASLNDVDTNVIWHTYAFAFKPGAGTFEMSSEKETGTPVAVPGGSLSTPVLLTLGAGSNVAPTGRFSGAALNCDVLHWGITVDPSVETADTRAVAEGLAKDQYLAPVFAAVTE